MLAAEKFAKMIAFLKSPACRRVRTNNHVERVNRKLRYEEKARYKWRKRRTTVRFLVLLLDRYWRQVRARRPAGPMESQPAGPHLQQSRRRRHGLERHDEATKSCRVQRGVQIIGRGPHAAKGTRGEVLDHVRAPPRSCAGATSDTAAGCREVCGPSISNQSIQIGRHRAVTGFLELVEVAADLGHARIWAFLADGKLTLAVLAHVHRQLDDLRLRERAGHLVGLNTVKSLTSSPR